MSATNGSSTTAPDPKAITDQLRREIRDLEGDPETLPDELTSDERWAQTNVGDLPITYSPAVTTAVDGLLSARPLSEAARRNALRTVDLELAARRRMRGQLPIVLRALREQQNLSIARLVSLSGIDAAQLHALESGAQSVRAAAPKTVADWIRPFDPPHDIVIMALRRSLRTTDQPLLAAGLGDQPAGEEGYVTEVIELLGWTDERGR
jgi:transcriptional regulator with XRE-family HTH domain